jgi:hypothetical protein
MTNNWPTLMGDQQRTGYRPDAFKPPLELAWKHYFDDYVMDSGIIVDGKVILARDYLYAFDLQTGEQLWKSERAINAIDGPGSAPLFWQNALWVVGAAGLYQFELEKGRQLEHWPCASPNRNLTATASKLFWSGGLLYYLFDLQQGIIDQFDVESTSLYLASDGERLYGSRIVEKVYNECVAWELENDLWIWRHRFSREDSFAIGHITVSDSLLYLLHRTTGLSALNVQTGEKVWHFGDKRFLLQYAPCVTPDNIYVAGRGLYALDRKTGSLIWKNESDPKWDSGMSLSAPPICIGSTIYMGGGNDRNIYAFDAVSGELIWQYPTKAMTHSAPAYADGHLVVGCHDGNLYCFRQAQA